MWAVRNETKFATERSFVRDRDGAEVWIVAVRATYEILNEGDPVLLPEQGPVVMAPVFFDDPAKGSLRYDSDLVRTKSGTDVLLHGTAYSPNGRPAERVETLLQVGTIRKVLVVHGDRTWERGATGLSPSEPAPFTSKPICYESAMGGPLDSTESAALDFSNPAGIGRIAESGKPVPAIELPDSTINGPKSEARPAGYGPIPGQWKMRADLAGTYDEKWEKARQPLVPEDFNDEFFRCAPPDQQVKGFLQGGEEVVLRNLTPSGLLRFKLPRVSLGFRTRIDGGITHHKGQLHTVIIEPDAKRLILVWQTALPCHHTLYSLKETVVFEKERIPLGGGSSPSATTAMAG